MKDENGNEIEMGAWAHLHHYFAGSPHTGLCGKMAWHHSPTTDRNKVDCPDCLRQLAVRSLSEVKK